VRNKVVHIKALIKKLSLLRLQGKKIAFTNGCFDLIHFGHISYLKRAKKSNRVLIVGLNSDTSVKKIKGKNRPILPQKERAAVLAELECVDFVVIFNETTPYKLISEVKPDILIKGADWKDKGAIGSDIVLARGGKVEYIKYLPGYSTTRLIERIIEKCKK
jgi:D-glycero-beta-D-manno-heptose 1-phosphate adenylyltransferase